MMMLNVVLFTLFGVAAQAQNAIVRTTGQYEADGTVLYSVYVATGAQKLTTVAVGGTVPPGTRFIENLDTPAGVVFEGVRDNVAVWTLKEIAADTLIGPFSFRAKPDGAGTVITEPSAAVSFQEPEAGIVEYAGKDTALAQLESKGSVIFDQRGTLDEKGNNAPVQIGKTGVLLFVPEGAVRTQTTVTVEREVIDNDRLPKTENPLWWCGLYRVSITPQEQAAKQFAFAFPNRRALTPGLPVSVVSNDDGAWTKQASRALGFNQFGGFNCGLGFGFNACFGTPAFCNFNCPPSGGFNQFGFGVLSSDRLRSTVTSTQLTTTFGVTTTPISSIKDGTSNIIAILIGIR
ncbi:MAG: hypothetical protein HYX27_16350 [Acidobacteria bacterium]|nr:hypothetical protein [Acidobacteriota bacterium]